LESIQESLNTLGVDESEWEEFLSATLLALRGWAGMVQFLQERGDRVVHPVPEGSLVEFLAVRLLLDRLALGPAGPRRPGFTGPLQGLREELRQRIEPPRLLGVEQRAFLVFQLAQVLGWAPAELHRLSVGDWGTLVEIELFTALERRRTFHMAYEHRFYT